MTQSIILAALFLFAGLFSLAGGLFNWNWFMQSNSARPFVTWFGRAGARFVYILIGVVVGLLGLALLVGNSAS